MAAELYPHNEQAYRKAVHMMQEHGGAALIHLAGTGKSFIAFRLAEEYPSQRIVWLATREYIFRAQKENYLAAGGDRETLSGITFLTYAKLMDRMTGPDGLEEPEDLDDFDGMEEPETIIVAPQQVIKWNPCYKSHNVLW